MGALIIVHADPELLAQAAAARFVTRIVDVQATKGDAHVVLTGGGVGTKTLAALAGSPARDAIDWRRIHLWWGDERFLPDGHPDRNHTQAVQALLGELLDAGMLPPERVHPMAPSDGPDGDDPQAAATRYADELAKAAPPEADCPTFDVLMLGVGPDGHVASLFPEHPALHVLDRTVTAVHGAPKPPPTRISLTFPALDRADQTWLIVAGAEKARAVHLALTGTGRYQIPAAAAHGRTGTVWLLDRAAAREVPAQLIRPASP